jgi:calcineurin-like phosphoesterase family protein
MINYWFTADLHLDHGNIIDHCKRPFTSAAHMNSTIMKRWNAVVKPKDIIIILGDFAWSNSADYVQQAFIDNLTGSKLFIKGNHDRWFKKDKRYMYNKKVGTAKMWCSHYPLRSWPSGYNLHGHCHGQMKPLPRQLDVGVDVWDFYPVDYASIMRYFDGIDCRRPDMLGENGHYKLLGDHNETYKNVYKEKKADFETLGYANKSTTV